MKLIKILEVVFIILISGSQVCAEKDTVEIGWIGPLTGGAAVLGIDAVESVKIAFDEVNSDPDYKGPRLKLVVEDDQYITSKTVAAYAKLAGHQGIKTVFIYTYSGLFALAERAEKDGVLLLDPIDCDKDIAALPQNVICIAKMTEDLAEAPARHAVENPGGPAGIVYLENDAFPVKMAEITKTVMTESGLKVPVFEGYQGGMNDFKPVLLRAKKAGVKSLFIYGYSEVGLALKQLKSLNFNPQIYSISNVASPDVKQVAGRARNGAIFPDWNAPRSEKYNRLIEKLIKRRGVPPVLEVSTIPSYDAARILAEALGTGQDLKSYFYALKDYQGISGSITVNADGTTGGFGIALKQVKGDEIVSLK